MRQNQCCDEILSNLPFSLLCAFLDISVRGPWKNTPNYGGGGGVYKKAREKIKIPLALPPPPL